MADDRREMLKGVLVAAVTPATPDYDVDYDRLRDHYRFIVEGGIRHGVGMVLAVGGGGEGYFLNDEEWSKAVEIFAEEVGGKVPTLVGVFDLNTKHAISKIKYAEDLGIDFVQLAPPHYQRPTDLEVLTHYRLVNDAVSRMGIVLYHTFWALPESYEMTPPVFARLAELENVVGIKWGSDKLKNFTNVLFEFRDRFAFMDNQGWSTALGRPHGMTSFPFFMGNVDPPMAARAGKFFVEGDYARFKAEVSKGGGLRERVRKAIIEEVNGPGSPLWRTTGEGTLAKAAIEIFGRPMGPAFPPQYNLSEEAKAQIKREVGVGEQDPQPEMAGVGAAGGAT